MYLNLSVRTRIQTVSYKCISKTRFQENRSALSQMERCIRINAENGQKVGFKITKTVVTDVNPGGLADNAGLKVGDRLVKVDGYSCRDMKPENIINFIKVSGVIC